MTLEQLPGTRSDPAGTGTGCSTAVVAASGMSSHNASALEIGPGMQINQVLLARTLVSFAHTLHLSLLLHVQVILYIRLFRRQSYIVQRVSRQ